MTDLLTTDRAGKQMIATVREQLDLFIANGINPGCEPTLRAVLLMFRRDCDAALAILDKDAA